MKRNRRWNKCGWSIGVAVLLAGSLLISSHLALAQANGNKATYGSSLPAPSQLWIDVSAFWTSSMGTQPDICTLINSNILTSSYNSTNYPNGAIIDARGLYNNGGSGGAIACSSSTTPFDNLPSGSPPPTTILLPASTIPISTTWLLPDNTRLVGEGQNTNLSAQASMAGTGYVLEMGSSGHCPTSGCTNIGIEHLVIDGDNDLSVGGIENKWAQTSSYVNDVNLFHMGRTGLDIAAPVSGSYPGATNSGPYSNVSYVNGSVGGTPVCADIEAQTKGFHGLTCNGDSSRTLAASYTGIYVNASNNSLEDVHIEYFWDGIEVGNVVAPATVNNVVISSVTGGNSMTNVVHICGPTVSSTFGGCSNAGSIGTVSDVAVMQVANIDNGVGGATTVKDDVLGTAIEGCSGCETPLSTAMYFLGEVVTGGGHSIFATNPANGTTYGSSSTDIPTWGVGGSSIVNGSSCLTPGALYSNTTGGSLTSVYVCTYGGWEPIA